MKDNNQIETTVQVTIATNANIWYEIEAWNEHGNLLFVRQVRVTEPPLELRLLDSLELDPVQQHIGRRPNER